MSYFYGDVMGFPGTGVPNQNLNDVVCGAPKGAQNQLANVLYSGNRVPGQTGAGVYQTLTGRFLQPYIIVAVSG